MATATANFQSLALKCKDAYRELVLTCAQGGEVDPDDALRIALAAGRSAIQLAADVDTATERFERYTAYHELNYGGQIEDAKVEQKQASLDLQVLQEKARLAGEECNKARERYSSLSARVSHLQTVQSESANKHSAAMRQTAGTDRNYTAWENFQLVR
jgi:hypothetical protein